MEPRATRSACIGELGAFEGVYVCMYVYVYVCTYVCVCMGVCMRIVIGCGVGFRAIRAGASGSTLLVAARSKWQGAAVFGAGTILGFASFSLFFSLRMRTSREIDMRTSREIEVSDCSDNKRRLVLQNRPSS